MTSQNLNQDHHSPPGTPNSTGKSIAWIIPVLVTLFFIVRAILGAVVSRNANVKPEPAGYTFFSMGNHYYEQGDYAKAIEQYNLAINLSPDFGEAYNNRGLVYFDQGKYEQAWADFDKAVQLTPLSATPYNNRGASYLAQGNLEDGLADLNKAIEMDQKFAKAYYNRGLANMDQSKTNEAIADFTQAIENTPEQIASMFSKYPTSVATGEARLPAGLTSFIDFIQKYVDLPSVYLQRGNAYIITGAFDQAAADLEKALELGSDPEIRQEVERNLSLLSLLEDIPISTDIPGEYEPPIPIETAVPSPVQETPIRAKPLYVRSLAIIPQEPGTLYAGTDSSSMKIPGSIFTSQDGGMTWSISDAGITGSDVWALAVDAELPTTIYAGTSGHGLFKSRDGGKTWEDTNSYMTQGKTIYSLAIDPANPSTIYAGGDTVFKSEDAGANWEVFGPDQYTSVQALAINPADPSTVYAGGGNGLFMSANGGADWSPIHSEIRGSSSPGIFSIAVDPVTPTTLYAGVWDGWTPSGGSIFKSTNNGQNWSEINAGLPDAIVYSIAIDPVNPANVYIGTAKGLFNSSDAGENWSELDPGLSGSIVTSVVIGAGKPGVLFAAAWDRGVFVYPLADKK